MPALLLAVGSRAPDGRFMTWNVNSLLMRLKKNREEVAAFLSAFDPDYIAMQVGNPGVMDGHAGTCLACCLNCHSAERDMEAGSCFQWV